MLSPLARRLAVNFVLGCALPVCFLFTAHADQSTVLTWNPSPDTNVVGYKLYYGTACQVYTTNLVVGNVTNITIHGLAAGTTYYFAATSYDAAGDESAFSNEASYAVPNPPPTLDPIADLAINENAGGQNLNVTGIASGNPGQNQTLTVTAASSNPTLIPAPAINYTSPNTTGTLTFAPALNAYGTATITVTVNNGGASNNIVTQTFAVTVNPVNQLPTLAAIANLAINENAGGQNLNLTGIASGNPGQNQTLSITAASSNPTLIPTPTLNYTSPNSTGTLTFAPALNAYGTATITVTVNNGGTSNNIVTQTFAVTVNPVNQLPTLAAIANLAINENAGGQNLNLTGIASGNPGQNQTLTVTTASSNPALIPTPAVNYTSPNSTATLTFAPALNAYGTATITVTVNNGGASNNIVNQTFCVTVNPVNQLPTLAAIANLAINENASGQNLNLTGIASGNPSQNQTLSITAASSNPTLIPTPTLNYTSPNTTGTLTFAPALNAYGTATLTVTVNNGGTSNNIATQTFTVTVNPVNQLPTLAAIANLAIKENAGCQNLNLTGITSGNPGQNQTLTVTAASSNPTLIPAPAVKYTTPSATGTLSLTPATNAYGTATITVTANNGGASNNIVTQTFSVTVNPVNQLPTLAAIANLSIKENVSSQTVNLTGIASGNPGQNQTLAVTAASSNPTLIPTPAVKYTSPNATGTLTLAPVHNGTGTATITVTVNNGGASNNIVTRTFAVTVQSSAKSVQPMSPTESQAATLTSAAQAGGSFSFTVSGSPGQAYVVQASSNLQDWVSLATNTAPFVFGDPAATQFSQRFYRTVSLAQ